MLAVEPPAALLAARDAAYAASLAGALARAGMRALPEGLRPRLPPALRETILARAALERGEVPAPLARLNLEAPRLWDAPDARAPLALQADAAGLPEGPWTSSPR